MKTLIILIVLNISMLLSGCDFIADSKYSSGYSIEVVKEGVPTVAEVILIFDDNTDSTLFTNSEGIIIVSSNKIIKTIVGMKLGYCGINQLQSENKSIIVALEKVEINSLSNDWIGTFGVYSTNSDGDVTFKYQGTFLNYYCSSYLPYLGEATNPNMWTNWSLTDFTPPWKGKKLLVPRRYQTYHKAVYGYSISHALFLRSNI